MNLGRLLFLCLNWEFLQNTSVRVLHYTYSNMVEQIVSCCLNSDVMRTNVRIELASNESNKNRPSWETCLIGIICLCGCSASPGGALLFWPTCHFSFLSPDSPLQIKPGWCHGHPSGGLLPEIDWLAQCTNHVSDVKWIGRQLLQEEAYLYLARSITLILDLFSELQLFWYKIKELQCSAPQPV